MYKVQSEAKPTVADNNKSVNRLSILSKHAFDSNVALKTIRAARRRIPIYQLLIWQLHAV